MFSVARTIAILSACGITASGFVGPAPRQALQRAGGLTVKRTPIIESPLVQRQNSCLRLYSEKELTEPKPAPIANSDVNGAVAIEAERDVVGIAIRRTLAWVAAAVCFGTGIGLFVSPDTAEEFFAGYLLEQSLSVDNLLVFLLLFEYFKVPLEYQNRVLNYGIIGAIVMRAIMIGAGAVAIQQFHAVLLGFAAILIFSSAQVLIGSGDEEEEDLSENAIIKFSNKLFKSTSEYDGNRFFTEIDGARIATPLLLCTVAIELSDVVFAVDSIPAVFGVTENPLVVFSSNMFAIMGLRSLYTILSKAAEDLEYLEPAVAIVLGFIGVKMIAEFFGVSVSTEVSLGVVITLLSGGVGLSLLNQEDDEEEVRSD